MNARSGIYKYTKASNNEFEQKGRHDNSKKPYE